MLQLEVLGALVHGRPVQASGATTSEGQASPFALVEVPMSDDVDQTKSPAFQFYPKDFLSDGNQASMSLSECGAYIRLLCICWNDGSLPNDVTRLAYLCSATPRQMRQLWPAVSVCFRVVADRLIHPRLNRERQKQETYRLMKAEAGQKGGRATAEGKQKSSRRSSRLLAEPLAKASPPSSSSSSSSSPTDQHLQGADAPAQAVDPDLLSDTEAVPNAEVAAFVKRFCELYTEHRHGAKYLVKRAKDIPHVKALLRVYGPARLERVATVLLTTDEEWVEHTDRGLGILSVKASWCDGMLAEYEAEHGVKVQHG